MLDSYNLNEIKLYSLLERQCHGRAKIMISSLEVSNKRFSTAKQILIKSFAEEAPQKFAAIKKLTELNMRWGKDDPFIYFAEFNKIAEAFKKMKVDLNAVFAIFHLGRFAF